MPDCMVGPLTINTWRHFLVGRCHSCLDWTKVGPYLYHECRNINLESIHTQLMLIHTTIMHHHIFDMNHSVRITSWQQQHELTRRIMFTSNLDMHALDTFWSFSLIGNNLISPNSCTTDHSWRIFLSKLATLIVHLCFYWCLCMSTSRSWLWLRFWVAILSHNVCGG